jgi:hypothetical protein
MLPNDRNMETKDLILSVLDAHRNQRMLGGWHFGRGRIIKQRWSQDSLHD